MPKFIRKNAPGNFIYEEYPGGAVRQGYLAKPANIGGVRYQMEVSFWPNGTVRAGRVHGTARLRGIDFNSFLYRYPDGAVLSGKPASTVSIGTLVFDEGQYIDFHPGGSVAAGYCGDRGKPGRHRWRRFAPGGEAIDTDATVISGAWKAVRDGMAWECSIDHLGFYCGAGTGNPHGEWGTSCTVREFLQGELADFPAEYMPGNLGEIVDTAVRVHRGVSSVTVPVFNRSTPLTEAFRKTVRYFTGSYTIDGSTPRCPKCRSTEVEEGKNSFYEFTEMVCRACGNRELLDVYQLESWYPE